MTGKGLVEPDQPLKAESELGKLGFAQLHPIRDAASFKSTDQSDLPDLVSKETPVVRNLHTQEPGQNVVRRLVANERRDLALYHLTSLLETNRLEVIKPVRGGDARTEHRHRAVIKRHLLR